MKIENLPSGVGDLLSRGTVIPAVPLALDAERRLDERRQRALVRYYIDAGAGGVAVGVHTTQFAIRDPEVGLFRPVLELASLEADSWAARRDVPVVKVAGACGDTGQAVAEAGYAAEKGYHACLLSLAAFRERGTEAALAHCREVAEIMPLVGFYLQPAVGGMPLPYSFWRGFFEIENVAAVKMAPFNRYATIDVVRALSDSGKAGKIPLYTGNDDAIVFDLLSRYDFGDGPIEIKGGLLGHWAVWTKRAVELHARIRRLRAEGGAVPGDLLRMAVQITDCNAAFFDAANDFAGCIPGIHEVLRRQGLLESTRCLDPAETLSPGQAEEISRVYRAYPELSDDDFVTGHLQEWLS